DQFRRAPAGPGERNEEHRARGQQGSAPAPLSSARDHSRFHTIAPPVIVAAAPPRNFLPLNGELRLFECERLTSNVHSVVKSNTVTSPGAPGASRPRFIRSTPAGPVVNSSTIRPTVIRPGCTSSESVSPI